MRACVPCPETRLRHAGQQKTDALTAHPYQLIANSANQIEMRLFVRSRDLEHVREPQWDAVDNPPDYSPCADPHSLRIGDGEERVCLPRMRLLVHGTHERTAVVLVSATEEGCRRAADAARPC